MGEQISQAISQSAGTNLCEIKLSTAFLVKPVAETVMTPEPDFEEIKYLCTDRPLRAFRRPTVAELEAIEDEIDLKDALKSLDEPGSIGLADFKKKLGI